MYIGNAGASRPNGKLVFVSAMSVVILIVLILTGCSGKPSVGNSSDADYSVAEYNADVDNLASILNQAKSLNHQIEAMDTNSFTSQSQVDEYNDLVSRYNSIAERYRDAVRDFNSKYAANAEGDGNRSTDPDNIRLPEKKYD